MKRYFITLIALCLAVSMLSGCTTGSTGGNGDQSSESSVSDSSTTTTSSSTGEVEQKLTFAVLDDPDSLDPNFTANTFAGPLFYTAYEALLKYDTENNLIEGAAESYTVSDDGLVYTFNLRQDAKWSDGTAVTSADFEFAWKRILDPEYGASNAHLLYSYIKNGQAAYDGSGSIDDVGIIALDDYTLEVTLESPCSFFTSLVATWTYMPVCKAIVEKNADWARDTSNYVSNGPFRLVDYKMGEGLYLVKNENYRNADKITLETLNFKIMQDTSTALSAYERGELDGMLRVPSSDLSTMRSRDDFYSMPSFSHTYWMFNTTNEVLSDVRVRKALALAVDRTSLIEDALQATHDPVLGHVPEGYVQSDGEDFRIAGGDYDLSATANIEEAKSLLAEAGYEDISTFPTLRLGYYTNDSAKKVAETLQQMYKQNLGIEMEIVSAEWTVYYDQVMSLDYDICAMGDQATYMHPMAFLSTYAGETPPLETGWRSAEYDALLEESLKQTDPAESERLMHVAEDLFMNDYVILPLYSGSQPMMMADYVENWYYSPTGVFVFDDIKIAAH